MFFRGIRRRCEPCETASGEVSGRYWTRIPPENTGETDAPPESGAKSGALSGDSDPNPTPATPADPDLAAVVAAWPALPPAIRAGVMALVNAGKGTPAGGEGKP